MGVHVYDLLRLAHASEGDLGDYIKVGADDLLQSSRARPFPAFSFSGAHAIFEQP